MRASGAAEPAVRRPPPLAITGLVVERSEASRPSRRILDRVSFVVEPGAIVALTGPSGAGKTTLLHAVAGLVSPDAGTVSWGDLDITALPEAGRDRWRRDSVGLVFQDFQLLAELGVLENILLPVRFDHWRMPRAAVERAEQLASRVGLDPRGPRAGTLSRGEQQRLAIARALMRSPQLILADEPTASLDADNSARIADLLIETTRETEASILLVSHDDDLLERAGRVHRLEGGGMRPGPRLERGVP
jgi:ABC-type lipoprotein export system ATPase subunit